MTESQSLDVGTDYFVLKLDFQPEGWHIVGSATARGQSEAIRKVLGEPDSEGLSGKYVAIPTRSWKPVNIDVKVQKTYVIAQDQS